jgi:hypothetical protein
MNHYDLMLNSGHVQSICIKLIGIKIHNLDVALPRCYKVVSESIFNTETAWNQLIVRRIKFCR